MFSWFKRYFIPHEHNEYHPHFWKNKSVGILFIIIIAIECAILAQTFIFLKRDFNLASILPSVLVAFTNDERKINNSQPLSVNPLLVKAAELKAQDMASKGYFAHITPDGKTSWYWLDLVGYKYRHAGENLAVNFTDSKDVINAWMNSPTHRANIVKQVYTEIGIAMAEGTYQGKSAIFVAQFFGTPGETATSIINTSKATTTDIKIAETSPKVTFASSTSAVISKDKTSTTSLIDKDTTQLPVVLAMNITPDEKASIQSNIIEPSFLDYITSSPRNTGIYALSSILILILISLLLSIFIHIKIQHPRIIGFGILLILIVLGLLIFNDKVIKEPILISFVDTVLYK